MCNHEKLLNKMSKLMENLKDTLSSFKNVLNHDELNLSFSSSLDSDVDTDDLTINDDLMSPL